MLGEVLVWVCFLSSGLSSSQSLILHHNRITENNVSPSVGKLMFSWKMSARKQQQKFSFNKKNWEFKRNRLVLMDSPVHVMNSLLAVSSGLRIKTAEHLSPSARQRAAALTAH